jgi:hypothetical protein
VLEVFQTREVERTDLSTGNGGPPAEPEADAESET